MKKIVSNFKIFLIAFFWFHVNSNLHANKIPDFSDLANELIPSVVSVSVMISRDISPNRPMPPQFPPGSPFEDFFKTFLREEGFQETLHLDKEEMKLLRGQVSSLIKKDLL